MRFLVASSPVVGVLDQFVLVPDNWNDWFDFRTMYYLYYKDVRGFLHDIGQVKIGEVGLRSDPQVIVGPDLPSEFDRLDSSFFSVGQSDTYYDELRELGTDIRIAALKALRDIAYDDETCAAVTGEEVLYRSLLRDIPMQAVRGQFRRIAHGGERLSSFDFTYVTPTKEVALSFQVEPESRPPTNVHVLIGRNGVGKTRMMNAMANAFLNRSGSTTTHGMFITGDTAESDLVNLVFVSFSAFELLEPVPQPPDLDVQQYAYVGLQRPPADDQIGSLPKSSHDLADEFVGSLLRCQREPLRSRWLKAVALLDSDPIFSDYGALSLLNDGESRGDDPTGVEEDGALRDRGTKLYLSLSSGHRAVLLTITRLVETVTERTLVLMDEPEGHLHPPLLSAFIRALSELLIDRNGVAIIATHSPVILQEVPKSCVWKVWRSGYRVAADRPSIETFGENVGILTREVFGLEVAKSGFHQMIQTYVDQGFAYEDVLAAFHGQLGDEGKAIAQALTIDRDESDL